MLASILCSIQHANLTDVEENETQYTSNPTWRHSNIKIQFVRYRKWYQMLINQDNKIYHTPRLNGNPEVLIAHV